MLLERCSLEQAERVADSIRQAIHSYRFLWGANSLSVGASIGVVRIARDTTSAPRCFLPPDIACYAAKDGGRNRVQIYERDHGTNRHREMQWVGRIARAVEDGRLELYAQRIVGISANRSDTPFFEIMVRLRDEDGTLVPAQRVHPRGRALQRHGHGGSLGGRPRHRTAVGLRASRAAGCRCWP
jgi:predicted signal transduction protein with EAL and GGDEF domain